MTINFIEQSKKHRKPTAQELFEAEKQDILDKLENVDIEAALLGAIMSTTGQNVILGVDHTLQRERCIEEAKKYNKSMNAVSDLLDRTTFLK